MRNLLLAAMATMGLVGCVGGIDSMTPGGGDDTQNTPLTAHQMFDQNVYSVIKTKCGGCHMPGAPQTNFVAAAATDGYTTATNYVALVGDFSPSDAPILSKIAAGHNGVVYSGDELTKITTWLNQEVSERTNGAVPPPSDTMPTTTESAADATTRVLKQWTACMTMANFNSADMANAWGNMNAGNNETCEECHTNGGQGFVASQLATTFYNLVSTKRQYLSQYFAVDLTNGTAAAKVMINTVSFTQVGTNVPPHQEHPKFNPDNNQGMKALKKFYDATNLAMTAGTCGTSTLTD